jgi:hypothetical protein
MIAQQARPGLADARYPHERVALKPRKTAEIVTTIAEVGKRAHEPCG